MKNKVLIIGLAIVSGLLILETGYLMGLGTQKAINRTLSNQYRPMRPIECMYSNKVKTPPEQKRGNYFVAATATKETEQAEIVTINIKGFSKEDISIEVKGRYLIVQARQNKEAKINNKYYSGQTQSAANFVQSLLLPDNAQIGQISAKYNEDTLTITIPRVKDVNKEIPAAIKIPID